jgi:hypothetical protein
VDACGNIFRRLELYRTAAIFREDLPDGMWEQLKEAVADIIACHGRKPSQWPDSVKEEFVEAVAEVFNDWGFSLADGLMS